MTSFKPKVSIIIPVYNGANYLYKAINSALSQSYENIEVVVVNDGSNDNGITERIALSYGNRIQYFYKENGGVASALNTGIQKMTGEYFSWLSHDDMYYPDKIEKQITALDKDGDYSAIIAGNVTVINENDQKIKSNKIADRVKKSIRCFMALDTDTGLNGCSLLIPKDLFVKYGLFDINLKATQDYDLWFKFSYYARFIILEDELVLSRLHDQQGSRTMGNLPTLEADQLHSKMLSKIELTEMQKFIGNDFEYLEKKHNVYLQAGYKKTAARIFSFMLALCTSSDNKNKASVLLKNRLLGAQFIINGKKRNSIFPILSNYKQNGNPTILMYCNVWVKGGIERVVSILLEELSDKYNFVLISNILLDNSDEGFSLPPDVCHIKIPQDLVPDLPYVLLILASLTQASLVVCHPNIIPEVLAVYPVMKASGIKTIACNHYQFFLPTWASWLYPVLTSRLTLLNNATVATWLTKFSANAYALHNNNTALMPNPNTFETLEDLSMRENQNIILCVGRFYDAIKRVDRMLKVFKIVLSLKPDARLVLVGDYKTDIRIPVTSNETLGELIQRLDFPEGSVIFKGEQEDVRPYYKKASVLMMTSDMEGFGKVLTEAGSYSIPSVVFDFPGIEDLIADGVNGYVIPQDDLQGMAHKIVTLLTDDELHQSMSKNSWEMIERYDRKKITARWSSLFETVLSEENSEELDKILQENFMLPPDNPQLFTKIVAHEYEKGIKKIISDLNQKEALFPVDGSSTAILMNNPESRIGLIRKTFIYFKEFGLKRTLRKIIQKLRNKVQEIRSKK